MSKQKLQEKLRDDAASGECVKWVNLTMIAAADRIDELERQLAEAREDQARLDFMAEHRIYVSWARDRECCTLWIPEDIDDIERPFEGYPHKNYDNPRQAIDAAIQKVKS